LYITPVVYLYLEKCMALAIAIPAKLKRKVPAPHATEERAPGAAKL
jgi:hypothetical protein